MGCRDISGFLHLCYFSRNRIDFRVISHPEVVYFGGAFRGEPGCFRYSDESVLFQELIPFIHAAFESYIIDSSFGPDQIEFFLLKRQSVHRTDNAFYSVFAMGFYCISVEYFDEVGEKIDACNLPFRIVG